MTSTSAYRVSDVEREQAVEFLRTAYADGRIEKHDLDDRLQVAMTATTAADLYRATAGLYAPPSTVARARPAPPTGEERLLGAVAQATGLIPVLVLPALIMATVGQRSAYVRHHAAGALNFQLTLLLLVVLTFGLGSLAYAFAWVVALVAAIVALTGSPFRYPLTLRVFGRHGVYPT